MSGIGIDQRKSGLSDQVITFRGIAAGEVAWADGKGESVSCDYRAVDGTYRTPILIDEQFHTAEVLDQWYH